MKKEGKNGGEEHRDTEGYGEELEDRNGSG